MGVKHLYTCDWCEEQAVEEMSFFHSGVMFTGKKASPHNPLGLGPVEYLCGTCTEHIKQLRDIAKGLKPEREHVEDLNVINFLERIQNELDNSN